MLNWNMRCPFCSSRETRVIDKRDSDDASSTRRRRECQGCGGRFTTYERPEISQLTVVKRDGRRQRFDRAKLWASIQTACTKRPISAETIERLVDQVEADLRSGDVLEVASTLIGDLVVRRLRDLDRVAYVRFMSVYHAFSDISSFEDELRELLKTP